MLNDYCDADRNGVSLLSHARITSHLSGCDREFLHMQIGERKGGVHSIFLVRGE